MMHTQTQTGAAFPRRQFTPNILSVNMANALVGRSVDISNGTKKITHGRVTGVLTEAGKPRIVVGRASYDLRQILTVSPA